MRLSDDARLVRALVRFGADANEHSTGTLLRHLQGTRDLLRAWGNPRSVCLAGLFHSVYGTEVYTTETVGLSRRSHVRSLIGPKAERLVYWFCAFNKPELQRSARKRGAVEVTDRFCGRRVKLSRGSHEELLELWLANLVEQSDRLVFTDEKREALRRVLAFVRPRVSEAAYRATVAALSARPK